MILGCSAKIVPGPAKPKLVARSAGSDSSPWKMKKDAPKLSVKDVPGNLRSLMSCALWRLHESIDRNDANELFLLSNQTATQKVAQKLNIIVRSTAELGVFITAKAKRTDLEAYGDVEREFNVQRQAPKQSEAVSALQNGEPKTGGERASVMKKDNSEMEGSVSAKEQIAKEETHAVNDDLEATAEEISGDSDECKKLGHQDKEAGGKELSAAPVQSENEVSATVTNDIHLDKQPSPHPQKSEFLPEVGPVDGLLSNAQSTQDSGSSAHFSMEPQDKTAAKATLKATTHLPTKTAESDQTPSDSTLSNQVPSSATKPPVYRKLQSKEVEQETEDSDEEVVVFVPQPKRFSNQKKQLQQQISRPSTPVTQPQNKVLDRSSKSSPNTAKEQIKPPSRGRIPNVVNHGHPPPTTHAPVVIDPDAFGRSFAVNPSPSPRNVHKPRSHHRLKRSVENNQSSQGSHHTKQQDPSASPPGQLLHENPRKPSPVLGPQPTRGQSSHGHPVARTSPPKNPIKIATKPSLLQKPDSPDPKPVVQPQQKPLALRMVESEEFVPRSAFTESSFGAIGTPSTKAETHTPMPVPRQANPVNPVNPVRQTKPTTPEIRLVDPNTFVPRDFEPINLNKARADQARELDADDFRPRSPTPRKPNMRTTTTPEPESIEPRASMPDVQYVLKSGSTRAATRGRGRLWVPT